MEKNLIKKKLTPACSDTCSVKSSRLLPLNHTDPLQDLPDQGPHVRCAGLCAAHCTCSDALELCPGLALPDSPASLMGKNLSYVYCCIFMSICASVDTHRLAVSVGGKRLPVLFWFSRKWEAGSQDNSVVCVYPLPDYHSQESQISRPCCELAVTSAKPPW